MTSRLLEDMAAGAALVHDQLQPPVGSSIVVFGCGPEGLGAVIAAADSGCRPIVVVDENPDRLLVACELGATHVIDPGWDDVVAAVLSLRTRGMRFAVDCTGAAPVESCLARFGRCVGLALDLGEPATLAAVA